MMSMACSCSNSGFVEGRFAAGAVKAQGAFLADRVRSLEDPILPGGQPRKDLCLHGLRAAEAKIGFHAGQGVGGKARALLEEEPDLILPVDVIEREGHEAEFLRLLGVELPSDSLMGC